LSIDPLELFGEAAALAGEANEHRAPLRVERFALMDEGPLVVETCADHIVDGN
jgi:hypothetical protein